MSARITGMKEIRNKAKLHQQRLVVGTAGVVRRYLKKVAPKLTGKLKNSFKQIISYNRFLILSDVKYAEIQNVGGKIPITDKMRSYMFHKYKTTGNSVYKGIALSKKSTVTIKGHHYVNDAEINRLLTNYVRRNKKFNL